MTVSAEEVLTVVPMPREYRAALLLLALALAGHLVRNLVTRPGGAPGDVQLLAGGGRSGGDAKAQRARAVAAFRPLGQHERVDVDRASVTDLARLPRVGISLAKAIVADREAHGSFGNLQGLDRVPGVGPGLLQRLEGHVAFSGEPSPSSAQLGVREPGASGPQERIDLNTAPPAVLEGLSGVGPHMASQIVAFRERHGPFPSVDDLVKVPGVGPATLARIRDKVTVK